MSTKRHRAGLPLLLELAVIVAAVATVPLTISQLQGDHSVGILVADWLIWAVFFVELIVVMVNAKSARRAARQHWLLLTIVILTLPALPAIANVVRLARLARIVRVARLFAVAGRGAHAIGFAHAKSGLIYVVTLCVFLIISGGSIVAAVEPNIANEGFWSGVWWAIVTTTTVGYGDISPETITGRIVATILMFAGIGLVSTLAATIATLFIGEQEALDHDDLTARLERIEAMVQELHAAHMSGQKVGSQAGAEG